MPEYTPLDHEVRNRAIIGAPAGLTDAEAEQQYDRWLADHDARVLHAATDAIHVELRADTLATYDVGTMSAYRALIRQRADRIRKGLNPDYV